MQLTRADARLDDPRPRAWRAVRCLVRRPGRVTLTGFINSIVSPPSRPAWSWRRSRRPDAGAYAGARRRREGEQARSWWRTATRRPCSLPRSAVPGSCRGGCWPEPRQERNAGRRPRPRAFPRNRHGTALGIRPTGIPAGGPAAPLAALGAPPRAGAGRPRPRVRRRADGAPAASLRPTPPPPRDRAGTTRGAQPQPAHADWLGLPGRHRANALITFLALDLNEGSGLALTEASIFVAMTNSPGSSAACSWASSGPPRRSRKAYLLTINAVGLIGPVLSSSSRARRRSR